MTIIRLLLLGGTLWLPLVPLAAQTPSDGQVRVAEGIRQAWDAPGQRWLDLEVFWHEFADRHGGLKWGPTEIWPPYEQLSERDLMIVIVDQRPCLMEFWHGRWRRANDVRRWDDAFNEFGGCPFVFQ